MAVFFQWAGRQSLESPNFLLTLTLWNAKKIKAVPSPPRTQAMPSSFFLSFPSTT